MAIEMKKTKVKMTKPKHLGVSILDISKMLMYKFWYDYIKRNQDLCNDVARSFDTSNYNENNKRPLLIGQNKKVPGIFKDELGGKIIVELAALRPKT